MELDGVVWDVVRLDELVVVALPAEELKARYPPTAATITTTTTTAATVVLIAVLCERRVRGTLFSRNEPLANVYRGSGPFPGLYDFAFPPAERSERRCVARPQGSVSCARAQCLIRCLCKGQGRGLEIA